MNESERSKIKSALADLAETIKRAYAENDVELYASAFDEGAIVSLPGAPPIVGRDALKSAFKSRPQLPPGATFEIDPKELEVINEEWAYAFGTDTLTIPAAAGESPHVETITFMVLIRKTENGWKTFREVLSPDQP